MVHMRGGLLLHHLQLSDAGVYTCTSHERSFSQGLARYRVHVIAGDALRPGRHLQQNHASLSQSDVSPLSGDRKSRLHPLQFPLRSYKGRVGQSVDEYCEQLWQHEKRRQQKLRTLKLKQEVRKARVRRNKRPEHERDGPLTSKICPSGDSP